ncbi:MAG: hypothetical protein MJZ53_00205 [Paludibacteraceae bacterium]|nr:hypothetical protein [Paludibacteraceae bacterium]
MKNKFKFLALAIMALLSVNVWGADVAHDFAQSIEKLLNNNASISGINISEQSYAIKEVRIVCRYNKTIDPAVTISVSVGGTSWGTQTVGNNFNGTKTFSGTAKKGAVVISFANNCGSGTGKGTFYVTNVQLVEGSSAPKVETSITLSQAGNESTVSGTYYVGDSYTLPSTTSATCGDKEFVGWSTVAIPTPGSKPTSNYYDKGASVTLAANNTFYAVFADANSSGAATSKTLSFTYNSHAGWTISTCTDKTSYYIINTNGSIVSPTFDVSNITQITANCRTFGGASYNTINVKCEGTTLGTITAASSSLANANISFASPKPSLSGTKSLTFSSTTTTTANGPGVASITITYSVPSVTYSNYTTTCVSCTAISPTLSYTAATTIGQVLNPTLDKKGSSGAVTYSIKSGGSYASINASTGALTCSATGTVTVQATIAAAGDYCDGTATSNAITISEPSYTITATKNDASLGNVSLSGKVITATPNACVGYDANSAYTVTSGSATVSQSGNKFTVTPSSNCTICINFDELEKDTYVDNLHGNTTIEKCGSYTAPSLDDAAKVTEGNCDVVHYHFAGWVTKTISTGTTDAPSEMITAGTNMNSTGEKYIAVWAKEE